MKCLSSALAFRPRSLSRDTPWPSCSRSQHFVAWRALVCGTVVAVAAWRDDQFAYPREHGFWDWLMLIVFALSSLRAFLWLIYPRGDEICVLSPNNLGDLSLHLNLIRYLGKRSRFLAGKLHSEQCAAKYPLGADLFNSVLEICGVDTSVAWFGRDCRSGPDWICALAWGGPFGSPRFYSTADSPDLRCCERCRSRTFQREMVWKNLFLSMFVTQRGLLFALPAGLASLIRVARALFSRSDRVIPFWLQLLIYASIPLFSVHAFLFLSLILLQSS